MSPASLALCTARVRRRAFSLSNRWLEWVFTVFSLTKSFAAISVAQSRGDEREDFVFAPCNAQPQTYGTAEPPRNVWRTSPAVA